MKLFTIGFTKKSAEDFFQRMEREHVEKLVDVRLNNVSQLAGFAVAKPGYLDYIAGRHDIAYEHRPELAPTKDILDEYKKNKGEWSTYEKKFLKLMAQRRIEEIDKAELDGGCLLCSEDKPHHCHRRLVAEYLRDKWNDVEIKHL